MARDEPCVPWYLILNLNACTKPFLHRPNREWGERRMIIPASGINTHCRPGSGRSVLLCPSYSAPARATRPVSGKSSRSTLHSEETTEPDRVA